MACVRDCFHDQDHDACFIIAVAPKFYRIELGLFKYLSLHIMYRVHLDGRSSS